MKTKMKETLLYSSIALVMATILGVCFFNNSRENNSNNSTKYFEYIYGYVYDEEKIPLQGVDIGLYDYGNKEWTTKTDNKGYYCFYNLSMQIYTLKTISLPSDEYSSVTKEINLYLVNENVYNVDDIILPKTKNQWSSLS